MKSLLEVTRRISTAVSLLFFAAVILALNYDTLKENAVALSGRSVNKHPANELTADHLEISGLEHIIQSQKLQLDEEEHRSAAADNSRITALEAALERSQAAQTAAEERAESARAGLRAARQAAQTQVEQLQQRESREIAANYIAWDKVHELEQAPAVAAGLSVEALQANLSATLQRDAGQRLQLAERLAAAQAAAAAATARVTQLRKEGREAEAAAQEEIEGLQREARSAEDKADDRLRRDEGQAREALLHRLEKEHEVWRGKERRREQAADGRARRLRQALLQAREAEERARNKLAGLKEFDHDRERQERDKLRRLERATATTTLQRAPGAAAREVQANLTRALRDGAAAALAVAAARRRAEAAEAAEASERRADQRDRRRLAEVEAAMARLLESRAAAATASPAAAGPPSHKSAAAAASAARGLVPTEAGGLAEAAGGGGAAKVGRLAAAAAAARPHSTTTHAAGG